MTNAIQAGTTARKIRLFIQSTSDGTPKTGLAYNSAGLALYYQRGPDAARTAITLAAADDFGEIGDGWYWLLVPDAAWTAGVDSVGITGNMSDCIVWGREFLLVDFDPSAAASFRADVSGLAQVVFPVNQVSAGSGTVDHGTTITVTQGDTPTLSFDLGENYTGWTVGVVVKSDPDGADVIAETAGVWTDAGKGQFTVTLPKIAAAAGIYRAMDVRLRNGVRFTAVRCRLRVLPGKDE